MPQPSAKKKSRAEDKMWLDWQTKAPEIYDEIYYNTNPLVSRTNNSGHHLIEKFINENEVFDHVLEVGAGTGQHLQYVKHKYKKYTLTDISESLLHEAEKLHKDKNSLAFEIADATQLPYDDNQFDRLVSVYNLEHLPQPHNVLKEWQRVVKPGGTISIAIPAEGGLAWRLGRHFSTRRSFAKHDLDLDYIIAREHINAAYNLISLIKHYFPKRRDSYYPLRIPLLDINLVYACRLEVL